MLKVVSLLISLLIFGANVVARARTCNENDDCIISCSSANNTCNGQKIVCPTSNSSQSYLCMISCLDAYSCMNTTIEAGKSVSTLIFESLQANASHSVGNVCQCCTGWLFFFFVTIKLKKKKNQELISNGAEDVEILCSGSDACDKMDLKVIKAHSVTVTVNSTHGQNVDYGSHSIYLVIQDSEDVSLNCLTDNSCYTHSWFLQNNHNVFLVCNGSNACGQNQIYINQSFQVVFQGPLKTLCCLLVSMEKKYKYIYIILCIRTYVYISKADGVTWFTVRSSDGALHEGHFELSNIQNFLLDIAGSGNASLSAWQ
ncbi:hypothetical protein RFI_06909, partial [Reticulomyxa filosa]